MSFIKTILLCILISFGICVLIVPLVIKFCKKLKATQTILKYVDMHKSKSGTATMGGVAFILSTLIVTLIFAPSGSHMGVYGALVMLAYGVLGFMDDFIKIKYKQNEGLKAYQKIIGQLGIALIVSYYCYTQINIGTSICLPFTDITFDMKWWYFPFCLFCFVAVTNAVNLTDGLDGLASSVTSIYLLSILIGLIITLVSVDYYGEYHYSLELQSLSILLASTIGGLMGFMVFNGNPAKIFMGDTGSLALGGVVAVSGLFSRNPLLIVIIGMVYIITCVSVIIQVLYFRKTHKRVFLMAPLHHHFEKMGVAESKIVTYYSIFTAMCGIVGILSLIVR